MVDPIKLTTDLIQAANEFLCGGDCKAKRKAEFFTAADAEGSGQTLVDQYSATPDQKSWLGGVGDGTIGVRVTKPDGGVVERGLWYNGESWAQACTAGANSTCSYTSQKPNATYDKVRVAAFFAATFGFSGLHQGEPKLNKDGSEARDKDSNPIFKPKSSQMAVLREGKRAVRVMLDDALAKFGQYKGIAVPTSIRITAELKTALNALLGFEFIEAKHIGHLLVSQNPEAAAKGAKKNSYLPGVDAKNNPGTGVIGIVYRGEVTLDGKTVADGRVEKMLYHSGEVYQQRCDATYTTCEFDGYDAQSTSYLPLQKDVPTANIAMATAALFGFGALYDDQLLKNFAPTGPKEETQRAALDAAFATFVPHRRGAASDLPVAVAVNVPEVVAPPPVAPPPVAEPRAQPPVDEVPAIKIPPPTADVPAPPSVVAEKPNTAPAPVAEPKPAVPPTTIAQPATPTAAELFANAVESALAEAKPAPIPTVTYEPLMSPAEAIQLGMAAWSVTTGVDFLLTASRIRRAGQPVTSRAVLRGVQPGLAAGGGIRGIRLRTVAIGGVWAAIMGVLALYRFEQSEVPLTVQSDLPADE